MLLRLWRIPDPRGTIATLPHLAAFARSLSGATDVLVHHVNMCDTKGPLRKHGSRRGS